MAKVKIDLSGAKSKNGEVLDSLRWANIPPVEGFIVLTHGEELDNICDEAVDGLVESGYATVVPVKTEPVDKPEPDLTPMAEKPKPKIKKKCPTRRKKK